MPVFFIPSDSIQDGTVTVTGPLLDHLRASLRTRTGEELWVGDEQRRRYRLRVTHIDRRSLRGVILDTQTGPPLTNPPLALGQAILKGDRMDWVVQKAAELGVAAIVPIISGRAIPRPKAERAGLQQRRWQRIAFEASQQAERWDVAVIAPAVSATGFFTQHGASPCKLILSERQTAQSLRSIELPEDPSSEIVLAIGPEGGWEKEECALALDAGFTAITLGERILRAETAAIAAISIVQSRLGECG